MLAESYCGICTSKGFFPYITRFLPEISESSKVISTPLKGMNLASIYIFIISLIATIAISIVLNKVINVPVEHLRSKIRKTK